MSKNSQPLCGPSPVRSGSEDGPHRGCEFFDGCTVYAATLISVNSFAASMSDVRQTSAQRTDVEKFTASQRTLQALSGWHAAIHRAPGDPGDSPGRGAKRPEAPRAAR